MTTSESYVDDIPDTRDGPQKVIPLLTRIGKVRPVDSATWTGMIIVLN
jgi:hypothetical protein